VNETPERNRFETAPNIPARRANRATCDSNSLGKKQVINSMAQIYLSAVFRQLNCLGFV
jgi:hypothetical protein